MKTKSCLACKGKGQILAPWVPCQTKRYLVKCKACKGTGKARAVLDKHIIAQLKTP